MNKWLFLFIGCALAGGGYWWMTKESSTPTTEAAKEDVIRNEASEEAFVPPTGPEGNSPLTGAEPAPAAPHLPEARNPDSVQNLQSAPLPPPQDVTNSQENFQTYEFPPAPGTPPPNAGENFDQTQLGQGFIEPVPADEDFLNQNPPPGSPDDE